MFQLPKAAEPLVSGFSVAFTRPTFQRVVVLILGAILSLRQRTVTGMLRAVGTLAKGHWSDFHRVLCRRVWSCWPLGKVLAAMVMELIPPDQPVICPVDDTTPQHKGKHVYGKGCTTPIVLARQLIATLIHWFPQRKFIVLGDGGYASHELAWFCHRHRRHVTLVSRCHPQANLYEVPSPSRSRKGGRPRIKGRRLPKPAEVARKSGPNASASTGTAARPAGSN